MTNGTAKYGQILASASALLLLFGPSSVLAQSKPSLPEPVRPSNLPSPSTRLKQPISVLAAGLPALEFSLVSPDLALERSGNQLALLN